MLALAASAALVLVAGLARADQPTPVPSGVSSVLSDLGFTLSGSAPDKNAITFTKKGLLVPTPWGDFEATIVSTPVDRMVRVPLSPNTEPAQQRIQPYVTAGARKNVDGDEVLEQARAATFGDSGRTNLKAGAGLLFKVDGNVELFGEYQFMRLHRDGEGKGSLGPLGTTLDTSGFSLGISVRY
jgi:opacity protein-like surface antigen